MFGNILKAIFGQKDNGSSDALDADSRVASEIRHRDATLAFLRTVLASEPIDDGPFEGSLMLAKTRIRSLPGGLEVSGDLDLRQCQRFRGFEDGGLVVGGNLVIGGDAEDSVLLGSDPTVRERYGNRVADFVRTPSRENRCPMAELPDVTSIAGSLVLRSCHNLMSLPKDLTVGDSIVIRSCTQLKEFRGPTVVNGSLALVGSGIERLPDELVVKGDLTLEGLPLTKLPSRLEVGGSLRIHQCPRLTALPTQLTVGKDLVLKSTGVVRVPETLRVGRSLCIERCPITTLSAAMVVDSDFKVRRCPNLASITGDEWNVKRDLVLGGCSGLTSLPPVINVNGIMSVTSANRLTRLADSLSVQGHVGDRLLLAGFVRQFGTRLTLTECSSLESLPSDLHLPGRQAAIDIAGTPIRSITKAQMAELTFRWRGVGISARALFEPELLTAEEVLTEWNAEVRRVMIERLGPEELMRKGNAKILDTDTDPGGVRELVEFPATNRSRTDPRRFLHCHCPSTGREYLLGVPVTIQTCHAGAAWLAGFENPNDYCPELET